MDRKALQLVCQGSSFPIAKVDLMKTCDLFDLNSGLFDRDIYEVRTPANCSLFSEFVKFLQGERIQIAHENLRHLHLLADEFGCGRLRYELETYQRSFEFLEGSTRTRLDVIEERLSGQERCIDEMMGEISQLCRLKAAMAHLRDELARLMDAVARQHERLAEVEGIIPALVVDQHDIHSFIADQIRSLKANDQVLSAGIGFLASQAQPSSPGASAEPPKQMPVAPGPQPVQITVPSAVPPPKHVPVSPPAQEPLSAKAAAPPTKQSPPHSHPTQHSPITAAPPPQKPASSTKAAAPPAKPSPPHTHPTKHSPVPCSPLPSSTKAPAGPTKQSPPSQLAAYAGAHGRPAGHGPASPYWDDGLPSDDCYASAPAIVPLRPGEPLPRPPPVRVAAPSSREGPRAPPPSGDPEFRWDRPPPASASRPVQVYADSFPPVPAPPWPKPGQYQQGRPFSGIIDFLTGQYRGNVVALKIVNVISSSGSSEGSPAHLVDFANKDTDFVSLNRVNQYVGYDFGDQVLRITHYSLRASMAGNGPKSWRIIVSQDGHNWDVADERTNIPNLGSPGTFAAFRVQARSLKVRYVAVQQTGPNHGKTNQLRLSAFEVFGKLGSANSDSECEEDDRDA